MPKKPDAAAELSTKLTHALESQRTHGEGAYPTTPRRLRDLAEPAASDDLLVKALAKAPFKDRALVAQKKHLDAPTALRDDLERLAASPALLDFALRALCTEASPTAALAKLKMTLDTALRAPFVAAIERAINTGTLPANVEWLPNKKALHPRWLPLPPEPKKPDVDLAEKLVNMLESQRLLGGDSYPAHLKRLVEKSLLSPAPDVLKKAQKATPFTNRVVVLAGKTVDPLLALKDDLTQTADSPALLAWALQASRAGEARAFTITELKSKVETVVRDLFVKAVEQRLHSRSLPPGVGGVRVAKGWIVFRMEDVLTAAPTAPRPTPVAPVAPGPAAIVDFAAEFERSFEQLNRATGGNNFVSLVALRRALPTDRAAFDRGLRALREAARFTLSAAADGRGLTQDDQEAGIREEGQLLLYVSRRW